MRARPKRFDSSREGPAADGRHETANGHRTERDEAQAVVVEPITEEADPVRTVVELPVQEPVEERSTAEQRSAVEESPAERATVEQPTASAEQPTVRKPAVEPRSAVEPTVRERPRPLVRALLFALPAILPTLWAALFVPLEMALVVGALAALPVAIVAVPWLLTVAIAAMLDR